MAEHTPFKVDSGATAYRLEQEGVLGHNGQGFLKLLSPVIPLIVVIDDRATNREIFARLAASVGEGVAVQSFESPITALEWITGRSPDLVITDYKMPAMGGAEFVRNFRLLENGQDVPVIVITAYDEREFRMEALQAGATDFLKTPVDHQEFVTRARNLLLLGQHQKASRSRADRLRRELEASEQSRENAIRESRSRLVQVIDTIPALISAVDEEGRCVFVNEYGAELVSSSSYSLNGSISSKDREVRLTGASLPSYEEDVVDRRGQSRTLLTSKYPLHDEEGRVSIILTTSFDITDQKTAAKKMKQLALHDGLTGLPNRLHLHDMIAAAISHSQLFRRSFALHFIDLDRFKGINDAFGHDYGDMLLREVAVRLRGALRRNDSVARLGGDEFAILQADVDSPAEASAFADRLVNHLSEAVLVQQRSLTVGASVGITLFPKDGTTVEQLLKNADLAMYAAKRSGRGRSHLFAPNLQTSARDTVLLEMDLRDALAAQSFELYYQPQMDVASRLPVGAEALIRWRRVGHDLVCPNSFLPIAEKSGLIVPLDRWVLQAACLQAAAWSREGMRVRVAANVSSATFRTERVCDLVERALAETALDPTLLELELTETTLLENQLEAGADLYALRRSGVRVAIDDFGTGFSSLAYLKLLPVDRLKIDRSFVKGLGADPGDIAIVRAIIGIGRSLGIEVLAEGVETAEQLRILTEEGCGSVQGFLFGQAIRADEFAAVLRAPFPFLAAPGSQTG